MWTCQQCKGENAGEEMVFCGRCGAARYAETAEESAHLPELPPPPAGYFAFRKMISPVLIRLLNVLGLLAFTGAGGYYLYQAYQDAFTNPVTLMAGLILLVGGNLLWRMACEILILFFSMHEVLVSIESRLSVRE